jgi:hypothetical protein
MPIIVVGQEKNFAALRPRLFAAKVSNQTAGRVAAEIRKANPHANLDRLTPGTVLEVPSAPSVRVRGEFSLDDTTKSAITGVANLGKSLLADLAGTAEQREKEASAERKAVLKALDSVGTGTASGRARDKELAKDLESARKALAEEDDRAKERVAAIKQAQTEWTAALDELKARLDD